MSLPVSTLRRTKLLLLGLRRSGKTSAFQVVFQNLPTRQISFVNSTSEIARHQIDSAIPLEIWDCPAAVTVDQLVPVDQFAAIIFVVDIMDRTQPFMAKLTDFLLAFLAENPDIKVEMFVHKCESYGEEFRFEIYRVLQKQVLDDLYDLEVPTADGSSGPNYLEPEQVIQFHLTSSYDHSIHEAFSKVLHKLLDPLPFMEDLLNVFCANSQLAKAFLFDVNCRLYVATDISPVESTTHSLCCDYVQLLKQLAPIYSGNDTKAGQRQCFTSAVQMNPDTTLAFWYITKDLAVLALLPSSVFRTQRGVMEYNLLYLRDGIREILAVEIDRRKFVMPTA